MRVEIEGTGSTLLVLAHGAGGDMDSRTMLKLRDLFVERGLKVARFNFLYKEEGRAMPDRMPKLMERYTEGVSQVRHEADRLICGGHSMGGRTASMLASEGFPMDGLLCLAYPLHPAGQPAKLRDAHLPAISVPTLCINGTKDELCTGALMEEVLKRVQPTFQMHWLEGADHSYTVKKKETGRTNAEVMAEIGDAVEAWLGSFDQK
jgi:predicted alpha/beta-hydrolase family hydrolase